MAQAKLNYSKLPLEELDVLSAEDKKTAVEYISKKFRVIDTLKQRTNYGKKQEQIAEISNDLMNKLLVLDNGLEAFLDAKDELK